MDSYIIGCLSGLTATSLVQPIDYIKVNSQLNPNINKLSLFKNIYNNNGFTEFYRGINIALIRQCVYGTIRLGLFQDLKDNYKVNPISAAVIAASVGKIINNPIDYLLIKKQTENNFSIKNIIKNEKINTILSFTELALPSAITPNVSPLRYTCRLSANSILEEAPVVRALYNSAANRASSEADTKNL